MSPPDVALALSEPLQLSFTVPPDEASAVARFAVELVEMMSAPDVARAKRES